MHYPNELSEAFEFELDSMPQHWPAPAPAEPAPKSWLSAVLNFVEPEWWREEFNDILYCEQMTQEELEAELTRKKKREAERARRRAYDAKHPDKIKARNNATSEKRKAAKIAEKRANIVRLERLLAEQQAARSLLAPITWGDLDRARNDLAHYLNKYAPHLKHTVTKETNTDG